VPGVNALLRKKALVLLTALVLGVTAMTVTTPGTADAATVVQAQNEEEGFAKWGQLLGLLGLAGLGGLALQRTDRDKDER
jgi:flagellar biogenesis protein FliO